MSNNKTIVIYTLENGKYHAFITGMNLFVSAYSTLEECEASVAEEFKEMMEFLREGDTLYVESFSRLSRSTLDFLNTVNRLQAKSVNLVSDKEKMDMSTPQGKFMVTVFAALSELERTSMLERQREGIEIAKAKGKYKGRKPIPANEKFFAVANAWAGGKIALKDAIRESGMSSSTFFRKCKQYEISKRSS